MSRATSSGKNGVPRPFPPQIEEGKDTGDIEARKCPSIRSTASDNRLDKIRNNGFLQRCSSILSWTPSGCRWDPDHPPKFSIALNLLFAFVSLFPNFTGGDKYHPLAAIILRIQLGLTILRPVPLPLQTSTTITQSSIFWLKTSM